MLSDEGKKNCQLLLECAQRMWGDNLAIIDIQEHNAPIDIVKFTMLIYGKYEVLLEYETGTFATSVNVDGKFTFLDIITSKKVVYGFESLIPDNLLHNFQVLDEVLRQM